MNHPLSPFERRLRYRRTSDRKVFTVTFYGHWTDIVASDGEVDRVKWFGGDDYISQERGSTYQRYEEASDG